MKWLGVPAATLSFLLAVKVRQNLLSTFSEVLFFVLRTLPADSVDDAAKRLCHNMNVAT